MKIALTPGDLEEIISAYFAQKVAIPGFSVGGIEIPRFYGEVEITFTKDGIPPAAATSDGAIWLHTLSQPDGMAANPISAGKCGDGDVPS